jgi:uncharacterized protein
MRFLTARSLRLRAVAACWLAACWLAAPSSAHADGIALGRMEWDTPLAIHWRVDGSELEALLPAGVTLDRHGGQAYVSLFALKNAGPILPLRLRYLQMNLRTYVVASGRPGIFLLDTRVSNRVVARAARALGLPYRRDGALALEVAGDEVSLRAGDLSASGIATGQERALEAGGLESFLLDREWLFHRAPGGAAIATHIEHAPWKVRSVMLRRAPRLDAVLDIGSTRAPHLVHLANRQEVRVTGVSRIARDRDKRLGAPRRRSARARR